MKKVTLFGSSLQALSATSSAQMRKNVFYDVHNDGDKNQIIVRGTPGLTVFCTLPQSPIRGMIPINQYLYVVADNGLYQVGTTGNFTLLSYFGSPGRSSPVEMAYNPNQLIIVDGANGGWIYEFSTLIEQIVVQTANLQSSLVDVVTLGADYAAQIGVTPTTPTPNTGGVVPVTPIPRYGIPGRGGNSPGTKIP